MESRGDSVEGEGWWLKVNNEERGRREKKRQQ